MRALPLQVSASSRQSQRRRVYCPMLRHGLCRPEEYKTPGPFPDLAATGRNPRPSFTMPAMPTVILPDGSTCQWVYGHERRVTRFARRVGVAPHARLVRFRGRLQRSFTNVAWLQGAPFREMKRSDTPLRPGCQHYAIRGAIRGELTAGPASVPQADATSFGSCRGTPKKTYRHSGGVSGAVKHLLPVTFRRFLDPAHAGQ